MPRYIYIYIYIDGYKTSSHLYIIFVERLTDFFTHKSQVSPLIIILTVFILYIIIIGLCVIKESLFNKFKYYNIHFGFGPIPQVLKQNCYWITN